MGRLRPDSVERMLERRRAINDALDNVIYEALVRLGGKFNGRTMDFRKHLSEALREAQIKGAIKRLAEAGRLKIEGANNATKSYSLVE